MKARSVALAMAVLGTVAALSPSRSKDLGTGAERAAVYRLSTAEHRGARATGGAWGLSGAALRRLSIEPPDSVQALPGFFRGISAGDRPVGAVDTSIETRLRGFLAEWVPKAKVFNFPQVWTDPLTGETTDFAAVVDTSELTGRSHEAEEHYLQAIDQERQAFVEAAEQPQAATWLREKARRLNEEHALAERGLAIPLDDPERLARWWFERELCKRDLYYLCRYVLGYSKLAFHFHKFMAATVQDVGPGYRGLREFPRDSYKTTVMGIGFCIQRILRCPDISILYKMNAGGNAANKTGEIRNHFLRGKALRRLFPEHAPTTRAEEGSRSRWRSPANRLPQEEATVTAAGVGSQKGGTSQHYDIVLADDFWDERSVTNAEKTAKVRKDMAGIEYLLAAPSEGIILYIGTRFAHDDPTAKLLKNPVYECIIASGITPAGRALFPEVLGLVHMLGQAEEVYVFSCQVMLNPTKDTMGFQREWFRYDSYSDLRRLELLGKAASRRVIVCDAAVTDDEESDCIAVMCLAIDHLGRVWVIDYVREKMQPSEFVEELYRMWDKWLPELLARQKSVVETTIMSFLRQREEDRRAKGKSPMRIYDYALRQRIKKLRITAALQPRFVRHEVIFDRDLPHRAELEQELLDHPNSQKDDGIDALSMIDDPVISKKPSFHPVLPPEPEPGPPTAGDYSALETAQRRAEAQAAFARLKGRTKGRHGRQRRRRR